MALSNEKIRGYMKRLLIAKMRILCDHGFYGLLLMHLIFSLDEGTKTAYTDGERIAFSPDFLDGLSERELDLVLMHEMLHIILRHCQRGEGSDSDEDNELYFNAADIVVNSIIMEENGGDPRSITLSEYGEAPHKAPDGNEGNLYTAEEIFKMLKVSHRSNAKKKGSIGDIGGKGSSQSGDWDDHSHWGDIGEGKGELLRDAWAKRFSDACEAISIRDPDNLRGTLPAFAQRLLREFKKPQIDWRRILSDFVQEEICDYSFSPPDRRFEDSPFFLPDFNEKDMIPKNILFMIDTSGSMSDDMISAAYSEINGALEQFNGKLEGLLGFFDAAVVEPKPFSSFEEFIVIKPEGGGTDFEIIFDYVNVHMRDDPPASIIILTDGYAPFPEEKAANGIPVLWLLNNDRADPPWGKIARITV